MARAGGPRAPHRPHAPLGATTVRTPALRRLSASQLLRWLGGYGGSYLPACGPKLFNIFHAKQSPPGRCPEAFQLPRICDLPDTGRGYVKQACNTCTFKQLLCSIDHAA